ncbi:MAG TPA: hypothetical protein VMJ32_14195 [Pirellulales bacterium]|nr:hypothetical protein [Pirellulales bacterium]
MDKVKLYLEIARKYHFWILCAFSAVAGLMAWYLASGKLSAQFQQDSQQINGVFSSLRGVSADQPHDDWTDGIKKETASMAQDVKDAWAALYKEQKEKVFVWPKEDLSADFLAAVAHLDDPNAELSRNLREYYQGRVKQQVSELAGIVDAPSLDDFSNQAINFAGGATGLAPTYHVDWSSASQQDILASFDWTERPSTLLVKYAQEELWVYRALCNVIKAVNEGTAGKPDAHITEINAMDIAYNAVEDSPGGTGLNRVMPLGNSAAAAGPVAGPTAPGDASHARPDPKLRGKRESGHISFGGVASADATANPDDLLKNYRYVKADGTPLMKDDVDADSNEYRLMPFRLLLKMDARYVDRLLVAFRNSVLPMEVQEVRINPEHTSNSGGGGGFYHAAGPGLPGGGLAGERSVFSPAAPQQQQQEQSVTVEIHGVVYLLKPPDPQKLPVAATTENAGATAPTVVAPTVTVPTAPASSAPDAGGPATATPAPGAAPGTGTPPATDAPPAAATPAGTNATPPAGAEPVAPAGTPAAAETPHNP